jgi:hypothetical protein
MAGPQKPCRGHRNYNTTRKAGCGIQKKGGGVAMILQFPTKHRTGECFNCGEVRKLRKEFPVCEKCPEPQTKDEESFLGAKFTARGWV